MASRGDIEAGKAHVTLYTKNSPLVKGLAEAGSKVQGFGRGVMAIGATVAGFGTTIVASVGAALAHFVSVGSALADMAARTGVAASKLAELKFAAEQTGGSLEDVEAGLRNMVRKGFSVDDFDRMTAAIAAIADPSERAAQAMEVFGKSGTKLLPMMADLAALRAEARSLGLVPTDQAVADADALGDAWDKVTSVMRASIFEVGSALAPMLLPALGVIQQVAVMVRNWVQNNQQLVQTIALIGAGLAVAGTVVATLGAGLVGVGAAVGGVAALIPVLAAIGPAVLAGVAAIAALAAILGGAYVAMRQLNLSVGELFSRLNALRPLLMAIAPTLGLIVAAAPSAAQALKVATGAMMLVGNSALSAAAGNRELASSFEEIATAAESTSDQIARSIDAAFAKRQRLREEFLTPDERGFAKEQEIIGAKNQVNRNRVTGFISEDQAAIEQRGLDVALARHRGAEAERRARERQARQPVQGIDPIQLPAIEQMKDQVIQSASTVTFSGAALLASGQAGGGPAARQLKAAEDQLKEAREVKKVLIEIKDKLHVPVAS